MTRIEALQKLAEEHIRAAETMRKGDYITAANEHRREAERIADLIAAIQESTVPMWTMPPTTPGMPPFTCQDTIT